MLAAKMATRGCQLPRTLRSCALTVMYAAPYERPAGHYISIALSSSLADLFRAAVIDVVVVVVVIVDVIINIIAIHHHHHRHRYIS